MIVIEDACCNNDDIRTNFDLSIGGDVLKGTLLGADGCNFSADVHLIGNAEHPHLDVVLATTAATFAPHYNPATSSRSVRYHNYDVGACRQKRFSISFDEDN